MEHDLDIAQVGRANARSAFDQQNEPDYCGLSGAVIAYENNVRFTLKDHGIRDAENQVEALRAFWKEVERLAA